MGGCVDAWVCVTVCLQARMVVQSVRGGAVQVVFWMEMENYASPVIYFLEFRGRILILMNWCATAPQIVYYLVCEKCVKCWSP